jgi:hypothetical protein
MKRKKLVNSIALFLFILIITNYGYAQEKNLWLSSPVNINGIADEWAQNHINYNTKTKLNYVIANDRYNLYILIKSADQPTNARILTNGITVSINPNGHKKEKTAITFPLIEDEMFVRQPLADRNGRPPVSKNTPDILSKASTIKISGFYKIPDGTFSLDLVNSYGIKAGSKIDHNKVFVYELSIPLSRLNISITKNRPVAYNIRINGSSAPANTRSNIYGGATRPGDRGKIPVTGGIPDPGFPGLGGFGPRMRPGTGGTIYDRPGQRTSSGRTRNPIKYDAKTEPVDFWVKSHLAKTKS